MLLMIIVIKVLLLWYLCDKPGPYIAFREEGILDNTGKKTFSSLLLSPEDRFLNLFQPTFSKVHVTSWNRIVLSISINFNFTGRGEASFIRHGFQAACAFTASSTFQVWLFWSRNPLNLPWWVLSQAKLGKFPIFFSVVVLSCLYTRYISHCFQLKVVLVLWK